MEETTTEITFFNEGGIQITNTRVILPSQTFAMSGITSISYLGAKPNRFGPVLLMILAVGSLMGGKDFLILALLLLIIGGVWFAKQKTKFQIQINTASRILITEHIGTQVGEIMVV